MSRSETHRPEPSVESAGLDRTPPSSTGGPIATIADGFDEFSALVDIVIGDWGNAKIAERLSDDPASMAHHNRVAAKLCEAMVCLLFASRYPTNMPAHCAEARRKWLAAVDLSESIANR